MGSPLEIGPRLFWLLVITLAVVAFILDKAFEFFTLWVDAWSNTFQYGEEEN